MSTNKEKTTLKEHKELVSGKREDGELIPPGKDRRGAGELLPKKQPKPTKPGKKELLTD